MSKFFGDLVESRHPRHELVPGALTRTSGSNMIFSCDRINRRGKGTMKRYIVTLVRGDWLLCRHAGGLTYDLIGEFVSEKKATEVAALLNEKDQ